MALGCVAYVCDLHSDHLVAFMSLRLHFMNHLSINSPS